MGEVPRGGGLHRQGDHPGNIAGAHANHYAKHTGRSQFRLFDPWMVQQRMRN
jgi:hypothetical protein